MVLAEGFWPYIAQAKSEYIIGTAPWEACS